MKVFRYAFFGLLVGATLGAILGSGQLFIHNRTKAPIPADSVSWQWALLGGLLGAVIMGSLSVFEDKKEKTHRKDNSQ